MFGVARSLEIFSRTVCFSKRYDELLPRTSAGQAQSHRESIRGQCPSIFCAPPNFVVSFKKFSLKHIILIKSFASKNGREGETEISTTSGNWN